MTWHDGEQIVQQHKDLAHTVAGTYLDLHADAECVRRPAAWARGLATLGGALVVIGYRLQSSYVQMTATAMEPSEALRLSSNGSGPRGH